MSSLKAFFPTVVFALALLSCLARGDGAQPAVVSSNWYEVLGVSPTATDAEVKRAYRKAAAGAHHDHGNENGDDALFKDVAAIWEHLEVPEIRKLYDQMLAEKRDRLKPGDAVRQIAIFNHMKAHFRSQGKPYETATYQDLQASTQYLKEMDRRARSWAESAGTYAAQAEKARLEREAQIKAWEAELQRRRVKAEAERAASEAAEFERLANERAEALRAQAAEAKKPKEKKKKAGSVSPTTSRPEPQTAPAQSPSRTGICWSAMAKLGVAAAVVVATPSLLMDNAHSPADDSMDFPIGTSLETGAEPSTASKAVPPGLSRVNPTLPDPVKEEVTSDATETARNRGRKLKDLLNQ